MVREGRLMRGIIPAKSGLNRLSRTELVELLEARVDSGNLIPPYTSTDGSSTNGLLDAFPTAAQVKEERRRLDHRSALLKTLRSTAAAIVTVIAAAVLVSVFAFPVFQIQGSSMSPTLTDGDVVIAHKGSSPRTGDLVAFYHGNDILVKRVIATAGQWVDIDRYGNVSVDGQPLDEPYLETKSLGECDITLPYQVPESHVFVMGDERDISIDSRSSQIGCVSTDDIAGYIAVRIWPLTAVGPTA